MLTGIPTGLESESASQKVTMSVGNCYNLANSIYDHIYMTTQHGFKSHSGINTRPCTTVRMLGQVLTQKELK